MVNQKLTLVSAATKYCTYTREEATIIGSLHREGNWPKEGASNTKSLYREEKAKGRKTENESREKQEGMKL